MNIGRVEEILGRVNGVRVAVCGDLCLDAYWMLDPRGSEVSIETGLRAKAVAEQSYSLGGGGNVLANVAALKPRSLKAIGVVGSDVFGRELIRQVEQLGADVSDVIVQQDAFQTHVYCKLYLEGQERPRVDFGRHNHRTEETDKRIIEGLRKAFESCDVVILNQQIPGSHDNPHFVPDVNRLIAAHPDRRVLVDSRHYGQAFEGVIRKTSEGEALHAEGLTATPRDIVPPERLWLYAESLWKRAGRAVFVTRGARGMLVVDDDGGKHEIPGIRIRGRTDPVGAGDTVTAALGCALAAGATPLEAAEIGNFAASVTVQKLFQTGTASASDILDVVRKAGCVCRPEQPKT